MSQYTYFINWLFYVEKLPWIIFVMHQLCMYHASVVRLKIVWMTKSLRKRKYVVMIRWSDTFYTVKFNGACECDVFECGIWHDETGINKIIMGPLSTTTTSSRQIDKQFCKQANSRNHNESAKHDVKRRSQTILTRIELRHFHLILCLCVCLYLCPCVSAYIFD